MARKVVRSALSQTQLDYLEALKRVYDDLNELEPGHRWTASLNRRANALVSELKRSGLTDKAIDVFV